MTEETKPEQKTISAADFEAVQERARRFEAQLEDTQRKLKAFDGVSLDEVAAMRDQLRAHERQQAEGKSTEELERVITSQLTEQFSQRIEALENENKTLKSTNKELGVVDKAMTVVGDKFNTDCHAYIKQLVRAHVDVNDQGEFVVKNSDGSIRLNASAKPMTLDEYAQTVAESHPSMAKATVTPGGKQPGQKISNGPASAASLPSGFQSWSQAEQQRWFEENPNFKPSGIRLN